LRVHPHLEAVFARLDQSRSRLKAAIDSLPADMRCRRPAADRWSAAEIVEHLALVEAAFARRLANAIAAAKQKGLGEEKGPRQPLPERANAFMADRSNRRTAADAVRPTGHVDDRAALAALEDAGTRVRAIAADADGLALGSVMLEHPVFGALSVYQMIELIARHEARHTDQILEMGVR
jgi:hypothetical protein